MQGASKMLPVVFRYSFLLPLKKKTNFVSENDISLKLFIIKPKKSNDKEEQYKH
jgi:hypothetical protein